MIEPDAELILVDRFIVDAPEVVRRPAARWQRIALEQRSRDLIHAPDGNRVAGELASRCAATGNGQGGRRVVDDRNTAGNRFGEDALSLQHRRNRRDDGTSDCLALTLVVDEKESPVPSNRSAGHASELIPPKLWFLSGAGGEDVAGVQRLVPEKLEGRPPKARCCRLSSSG